MPSKSKSQHNLMAMVAHDPKAAKRVGIPQSVGRDYVEADKGRKFKFGGSMKKYAAGGLSEFGEEFKKHRALGDKTFMFKGKKYTTDRADDKPNSLRSGTSGFDADVRGAQLRARMDKELADRTASDRAAGFGRDLAAAQEAARATRTPRADAEGFQRNLAGARNTGLTFARGGGIESRGKTKGKIVKMARGGSVGSASKRADGIATKGKTKGRMIAMNKGGSCY